MLCFLPSNQGCSLGIPRQLGQIDAMTYASIAREEAVIVERSGLLGEGSSWAGRQVVSRFFIEGFGSVEQRATWLPHLASVAISEPRVGAHPKLLTTRAEADGDGYSITGEKAWVTNGPLADVFIVLAVMAVEDGRKRYGAFLMPRDTPGVSIKEMPEYRALAPSRHCGLVLDGCRVSRSALLGPAGSAYEAMALPFRDVEDAVGTFGLLGAFRFLERRLARGSDDAALSLGGLVALTAVFAATADTVVRALDDGALEREAAALVGLRVLAAEMLQRARIHRDAFGPTEDADINRTFRDLDTSLSVARGPRLARQARLGKQPLGG
jgi:acyl-CoA dehydrogenase